VLACSPGVSSAENWPNWRGPDGTGVSHETDLPLKWSPTENIRWHVPLPDRGNSTPVVWGDRVFITQPVEKENRRTLMCFDRAEGKLLWQSGITYTEKETTHETNPACSPSPVTDGRIVIVWYGSPGLYAYDFKGKELWHRDLGLQQHMWGNASSPILHGDLCILTFGPGNREFVVAVDKRSGRVVWQKDAPPYPEPTDKAAADALADRATRPRAEQLIGSFATPIIVRAAGRDELIVGWPGQVSAYTPKTGKELWFCKGVGALVYASPMWAPSPKHKDGVVIVFGGYNMAAVAVEPGGSGDVTETRRLWHTPRTKLRLGNGVVRDGYIYINDMNGVVHCLDLHTAKVIWEQRLTGPSGRPDNWSSMVLAGDRIYLPNQEGDCFVVKASPQFELLATNSLGEYTNSSPAVSDGEIFLRTYNQLWCVTAAR